jgi:transcriptional regulator with XRE-family HTH domain
MSNEMGRDVVDANFQRLTSLAGSLEDVEFRGSYMAHHLRAFLADQIRGLRGDMSQKEFGELIGKPQSVVSRLESEDYRSVSLQTLIEIAIKLNIAFLGRFVDFPTFLRATADFSEKAIVPAPYNKNAMDALIEEERRQQEPEGALRAFLRASYEGRSQTAITQAANTSTPQQTLGAVRDLPGVQAAERSAASSSNTNAQARASTNALEPAA